jgi:hypothetical protein
MGHRDLFKGEKLMKNSGSETAPDGGSHVAAAAQAFEAATAVEADEVYLTTEVMTLHVNGDGKIFLMTGEGPNLLSYPITIETATATAALLMGAVRRALEIKTRLGGDEK